MHTGKMLALLVVGPLTGIVIGCGGAAGVDTAGGAEEDLTGALSQGLVCASVTAYNDHADLSGLKDFDQKDLKGQAAKDFKAWQKGMVDDYPSSAYELPVPYKGKTYTFILVVEMNDGGGSVGIYRRDGRLVTVESGSESDLGGWSAPADTCPQ